MSLRAATRVRLEASHAYSAFYRGYYANHLPMALVALDHMGASDAQVAEFADRYASANLEPIDPDSGFAARVREFEGAIAKDGRESVLRQALASLTPAVGSGAFHGAIRAAYALQTDSDREWAHALAYWSEAFAAIDVPAADGPRRSAQESLAAVHAALGGTVPASGSIAKCMAAGARDPRFASWCAGIADASDVEGIAPALIELYARTRNFTVLHAVTGCHAVRLLAPFAPDAAAFVRAFQAAVIAVYAGCGAPAGEDAERAPLAAAWPEVLADAVRCTDEHDVKLVYTCWREWQHRGGEAYLRVAAATAAAGARSLTEPAS